MAFWVVFRSTLDDQACYPLDLIGTVSGQLLHIYTEGIYLFLEYLEMLIFTKYLMDALLVFYSSGHR
jgi:hypothetical protein